MDEEERDHLKGLKGLEIDTLLTFYEDAKEWADESRKRLDDAQREHIEHNIRLQKEKSILLDYVRKDFEKYLSSLSEKATREIMVFGSQFVVFLRDHPLTGIEIVFGKPLPQDPSGLDYPSPLKDITSKFSDFVDDYKPLEVKIKEYEL